MPVTDAIRAEIREWAEYRARQDAMCLGIDVTTTCSDWFQEKIWHYEKIAYLKIQNRESRMAQ